MASAVVDTSAASGGRSTTIETKVPARLDRLPWSRFHWLVVIGLGTVWTLDGLEVTIVGSIGARLTQPGAGLGLTASTLGSAAATYVAGACVGALFFGQLTDRFGRKRLFTLTLGLYICATIATAFSFAPWYFLALRFVTGMGIGGEYAAINSAIDELIPARVRGRVDLMINGSYWLGALIGGVGSIFLLNTSLFPANLGWRLAFGIGAVLGLAMILIRRNLPESPRWLYIHGRNEEAEQVVAQIEADVERQTGKKLDEPRESIEVHPRQTVPFREIARVAIRKYPRRTMLGLALFVGQAFLYNAITFDLGTILAGFFGVGSGNVPYFVLLFAAGNLLGPLTLGRLFDTVGRKPMISVTYLGSAAVAAVLGVLLLNGGLDRWSFIAIVGVTFFLASAGASSAYLTVSEIFPMETRALSIAFFYAVGTGIGGITGPLLFGNLINSGRESEVAIGFFIGAAMMALGGIAEIAFGVRSEQKSLEAIAEPLSAERTDSGPTRPARRYSVGAGTQRWQTGMSMPAQGRSDSLVREVEALVSALGEREGSARRRELRRSSGSRYWGPGHFDAVLRDALRSGEIQRVGRSRYSRREDTR
ncbi:MAG: MFS transporter [Solirubrobacteraceae bacterium]|jgi:MFS family permease